MSWVNIPGAGEIFEVAGMLDRDQSRVHISSRFSPEIRRFTMAHELGHVLLHEGSGLHRDRALDGSQANRPPDPTETEANNFASYFLMPEKQVRAAFQELFHTDLFVLDADTAFALDSEGLTALQNRCRSLRDLTRLLAGAERFGTDRFDSLAKLFRVSIEAMAIRLEELKLVSYS